MTAGEDKKSGEAGSQPVDENRRGFLKVAVTVSALFAVGGIAAVTKSITEQAGAASQTPPTQFPKVKIANVSDLQTSTAVFFNYPLDNESNILVKLGVKAADGVGPDSDIVAFSQVCQHLGCLYNFQPPGSSPPCNASYKATTPVGYCCCHGSIYDFTDDAKVIGGPAPRPQPRVILEVDSSGAIYATGMTPPAIFGHNTGSNDVSNDLQGGTLVS